MIHAEFLDSKGAVVSTKPLPMMGQSDMHIFNLALRSFHQRHTQPGVCGHFVESSRRMGVCEVVEVIGLRQKSADQPGS
jgi:hypothetical protein